MIEIDEVLQVNLGGLEPSLSTHHCHRPPLTRRPISDDTGNRNYGADYGADYGTEYAINCGAELKSKYKNQKISDGSKDVLHTCLPSSFLYSARCLFVVVFSQNPTITIFTFGKRDVTSYGRCRTQEMK